MNSRLLQEYINFTKMTKGKHLPIVWTCPGLVFGFNYSILKLINSYRQILNHSKTYLVINTWDTPYNLRFVKALQRLTDPKDGEFKSITLILTKEKYEESKILDHCTRLLTDLNITKIGDSRRTKLHFSSMHFKRMVYFYSHFKTFSYILRKFDNNKGERIHPLVIRLSPKMFMSDHKWVHSHGLKMFLHLFEYAQKHLCVKDLDKLNHPFDILYTMDSGTSYYDDMLYCSSPDTLVNIFGNSEEEFYHKMLSFYQKYIERYPGTIETDEDFSYFGKNRTLLPLEGSTIMKQLADDSKRDVINVSCRWMGYMINGMLDMKNPWYSLLGKELVPPEELKTDKMLKQYLNYGQNVRHFITSPLKSDI